MSVRRDGDGETNVRLTGFISRLTSPSRNHAELVDIWFEIERSERSTEWDEAFARVAEGWRPDPRHQSHFALFSHPYISALIVARQVTADRAVWSAIEIEARVLVARVNRAVADQRALLIESQRPGDLSRERGGAPASSPQNWLGEVAQAIRGLVPKPGIPVSHSSSTAFAEVGPHHIARRSAQ